jgi:hypothetical protein
LPHTAAALGGKYDQEAGQAIDNKGHQEQDKPEFD